jgi:hypothetical protein
MSKLKRLMQQIETGEVERKGSVTSKPGKLVALVAGKAIDIVPIQTGSTVSSRHELFEQLKAAMETDLQRLSSYNTLDEKSDAKAELLPNYTEFTDDYVNQGHDYPNSVAVNVMIWSFDVGDIDRGVTLGLHLAKTGNQQMPTGFKSTLETFICDQTYEWATKQLAENHSPAPFLTSVVDAMQADSWPLNEIVQSKMFAIMARHFENIEAWQLCLEMCEKAEAINPKGEKGAGCKGRKKKAQDALTELAEQTDKADNNE